MEQRPFISAIVVIIVYTIAYMAPANASQPVNALDANDIVYLTEDNPPANFIQDGELRGMAVDLLKLIWAEIGISPKEIQVLPWARAYQMLRTQPGTCLFSTSWTKSRNEVEKFKWVGPIKRNNIVLVARKSLKIKLNSLDDARNYIIGTNIDDGAEKLLLEAGFSLNELDRVPHIRSNVKKLAMGRIDLYAKNTNSVFAEIGKQQLNPDDFEVVWVLSEKFHYYAFHKDTSQQLIDRFQGALNRLEEQRQALLESYAILDK